VATGSDVVEISIPCFQCLYFCIMKIRNEDLGKLNELKLDLLSPPYSFRLAAIASDYINKTIGLISKYVDENNNYIEELKELKTVIESTSDMSTLKDLCKQGAIIITNFTLGH
jgi:hypothetical protein